MGVCFNLSCTHYPDHHPGLIYSYIFFNLIQI
nr:MAG TPA: aspartate racemase [Caudoviricetes sp.]